MTSSQTSTVQTPTLSSSSTLDPSIAMTMQLLQQMNNHGQTVPRENFWEKGQFWLGALGVLGAAAAFFFYTVMGLKDELSSVKTALSVIQSEHSHTKVNVERLEKNTEKLEKTTEKLIEINTEIALLKARNSGK